MAGRAPVFPAFTRIEYKSDNQAINALSADLDRIVATGRKKLSQFADDAKKLIDSAFTANRTSAGSLDLGSSGLREAARAAKDRAVAAKELASAIRTTMVEEKAYGLESRQSLVAAKQAAKAEEDRAASLLKTAAALDKVQERLNRQRSATISPLGNTRPNLNFGVDQLLKGQASIDRAALSGTTLDQVLGRVGSKGTAVMAALDAGAQQAARGMEEAKIAAQGYEIRLESVLRAIDPTRVAQQRLDVELARADEAFARGSITAEQYGVAVNHAANNYEALVTGTRRGTEANHMMVNSTRAMRVAMVQSGQQLQDVAISLYSGQRAGVVFAQQLPQLAFALSGLEGSANKTHDRIGKFATFLSGPWGLAVGFAVGVLATMVTEFFTAGDAADKTKSKTMDLGMALQHLGDAHEEAAKAIDDYNESQGRARRETDSMTQANLDSAEAKLKEANATREQLKAELERQRAQASNPAFAGNLTAAGLSAGNVMSGLDQRIAANSADVARIGELTRNLRVLGAVRDSKAAVDPLQAINNKYDDMAEAAKRAAAGNDALSRSLTGVLTKLELQRKAALDAAKPGSGGTGSTSSVGDMTALLKNLFGAGTYVGDNTKHSKYVAGTNRISDHTLNRALDFVPPGGMGSMTKDQVRSSLEAAGVRIRRNAAGVEQLFGPGDKGHSDHFHVAWQGGIPSIDQVTERLRKQREAAEAIGTAIAGINSRYDDQPKLVDEIAASTKKLDDIMADLQARKPEGWQAMLEAAQKAKDSASTFIDRDIKKWADEGDHQMEVQRLMLAGYDDMAAVMDTIYKRTKSQRDLNSAQTEEITKQVQKEQEFNRELQKRQEIQNAFLDASRSIRSELESFLSGNGNLSGIGQAFRQMQGKILFESLFGDAFRQLDQYIKHNTGIEGSVDKMVTQTTRAGDAAGAVADAFLAAAARVSHPALGVTGNTITSAGGLLGNAAAIARSYAPSESNPQEIVVTGVKIPKDQSILALSPTEFISHTGDVVSTAFGKTMDSIFSTKFFGKMSGAFSGAFQGLAMTNSPIGAAIGALTGIPGFGGQNGIFGKALSGMGNGTLIGMMAQSLGLGSGAVAGGQIGGALAGIFPGLGPIGSIAGALLGGGKLSTGRVAGTVGGAAIGMLVGGPIAAVIGSIIGSLFGGAKKGSASVTNSGISRGIGSNGELYTQSATAGGQVQDALSKIAKALNVAVGSYGLTIGMRDKEYRVSGNANADVVGKSPNSSQNIIYRGTDATAALEAAIRNAIQDGAFKAIGETANRILTNGAGNIDQAVQDTMDFVNVFKQLKSYTDPVGYALDELDSKFSHLKDIFISNGASAQEYADLEKLYGIERAKAIDSANQQIIGSLKSLYEQLTVGDSGLSLRDRQANAMSTFNPLLTRVKAGDTTAYDAFATAANTVIDLQRQISGSQSDYFDLTSLIETVTKSAIDAQTTLNTAAANRDSPFTPVTVTTDNTTVVDALQAVNGTLIYGNQINAATNAAIQQLISNGFAAPSAYF